jgi:hypothetical protein
MGDASPGTLHTATNIVLALVVASSVMLITMFGRLSMAAISLSVHFERINLGCQISHAQ